jgi:hypothetical protein
MKQICALCKTGQVVDLESASARNITGGVCASCERSFNTASDPLTLQALADSIEAPILVMRTDPRLVYTANSKALELFEKKPDQVEKHRGGEVFDCVYAFTEAGCGKDAHCGPCKIKNAIVETLSSGRQETSVSTWLEIRKNTGTRTYAVQISTEKIGNMALVRIDHYKEVR